MDQADVRGEVEALYSEANADPSRPPGALWLADRVMARVLWIPGLCTHARLCRESVANDDGKQHRIELRDGLTIGSAQYYSAHELGEYRIEVACWGGVVREWREHAATQIGVGILAPDQAVARLMAVSNKTPRTVDIEYMSRVFQITQPVALLRLGEALGWPVALVNREPLFESEEGLPYVQMRGDWPRKLSQLEAWRLATGKAKPKGTRKIVMGSRGQFVALIRTG